MSIKLVRSFSAFSTEYLLSLPKKEEIESFSDTDLAKLENLSNILDNMRYLEKERRNKIKLQSS